MSERFYRAQLLIEPEQHEALKSIAMREDRSLSDVARDTLRLGLECYEKQQRFRARAEALRRMSRGRDELREQIGVIGGDPVSEVREERERQIEDTWR